MEKYRLHNMPWSGRLSFVVLAGLVAIYIGAVIRFFWCVPMASDPTQYIEPVVWGSMWGHFYLLDRLMIPLGVQLFAMVSPTIYQGAAYFIGTQNVLLLVLSMAFAYRWSGFVAALLAGIALAGSYFFGAYATYVYPNQSVALYSLIAFGCFYFARARQTSSSPGNSRAQVWMAASGFFTAWAMFSKITALATLIYFVVELVRGRDRRSAFVFFLGWLAGAAAVIVATWLFFGGHSLLYVWQQLGRNITGNLTYGGTQSNLTSYYTLLVDQHMLPMFLALFVLVGAYRDRKARRLLLMALSHLGLLYAIFTVSKRAETPISNYVYTAFIFTVTGVAVYLGNLVERHGPQQRWLAGRCSHTVMSLVTGVTACALLVLGYYLGSRYSPQGIFSFRTPVDFPDVVRWFYTLGPIAMAGLLTWMEFSRSRYAVVTFTLVLAVWSSAYAGGLAIRKVAKDRAITGIYYSVAPVFNEVPSERFAVYMEGWNRVRWGVDPKRVLWIYRLFFDEKYPRAYEPAYTSYQRHKEMVEESIEFIQQRKDLARARGQMIVTDNIMAVRQAFPNARPVRRVPVGDLGFVYVFDISAGRE